MKGKEQFKKNLWKQLGIAGALIIPLGITLVFLRTEIKESTAKAIETQKRARKNAKILSNLSQLKSQYKNSAKNYLSVIENVLPSKNKLINISKRYQNLAESQNINFGFSFIKEQEPTNSKPGFIKFQISASSKKIDNIIKFAEELEDYRFITTVQDIQIKKASAQFESKITGKVYYQSSNNKE
ncbi:MAG: hypothetical protein ABEI53_00435 [Candidatus Magasanikbacteria bacterium]